MYEALVSCQEAEQIRIGRDLHDQTGHFLSAIKYYIQNTPDASPELNELAFKAIESVRAASHNLSPPGLEESGLEYSIRYIITNVFGHLGFQFDVQFYLKSKISDLGKLHIYRIAAELLNNAVKYSGGTLIAISLKEMDNSLELTVADNGQGMDESQVTYSDGLGWQSINNRIAILNGSVEVETSKAGTKVKMNVPLNTLV